MTENNKQNTKMIDNTQKEPTPEQENYVEFLTLGFLSLLLENAGLHITHKVATSENPPPMALGLFLNLATGEVPRTIEDRLKELVRDDPMLQELVSLHRTLMGPVVEQEKQTKIKIAEKLHLPMDEVLKALDTLFPLTAAAEDTVSQMLPDDFWHLMFDTKMHSMDMLESIVKKFGTPKP